MFKLIFFTLFLIVSAQAFAGNVEKETLDFLVNRTIENFHEGIERYNQEKEASAPAIKKVKSQLYQFVVKQNKVHFSLVNYLNDQIYVNGRLTQMSTFGPKKTTWIDSLITPAYAEEGELDAESTKVILATLGSLSGKLEEVGMVCFAGCKKEVKEKNLKKIMASLDRENQACSEAVAAQEDSMRRLAAHGMVSMLHSTFSPEFQSVRNFFKKVSESNRKAVDAFMEKKLAIDKDYKSCVGVMTSGTVADGSYDSMSRGVAVFKSGGFGGIAMEAAIEQAKSVCVKIEEFKGCLVAVRKNLTSINNIKRAEKQKTGVDFQEETLPSSNAISR